MARQETKFADTIRPFQPLKNVEKVDRIFEFMGVDDFTAILKDIGEKKDYPKIVYFGLCDGYKENQGSFNALEFVGALIAFTVNTHQYLNGIFENYHYLARQYNNQETPARKFLEFRKSFFESLKDLPSEFLKFEEFILSRATEKKSAAILNSWLINRLQEIIIDFFELRVITKTRTEVAKKLTEDQARVIISMIFEYLEVRISHEKKGVLEGRFSCADLRKRACKFKKELYDTVLAAEQKKKMIAYLDRRHCEEFRRWEFENELDYQELLALYPKPNCAKSEIDYFEYLFQLIAKRNLDYTRGKV